jgi:hypothetical protein
VAERTYALAAIADVRKRIRIVADKSEESSGRARIIVTNSGHVRPIDRPTIGRMKRSALARSCTSRGSSRRADVDLIACCGERGIPVAGTNEATSCSRRFLVPGTMAGQTAARCRRCTLRVPRTSSLRQSVLGLHRARFGRCRRRRGPRRSPRQAQAATRYDAIVLAMRPRDEPAAGPDDGRAHRSELARAVLAQGSGATSTGGALCANGIPVWPPESPASGHMAILPSAVGPEPDRAACRTGGLKVGELLWRVRVPRATNASVRWTLR